MKKQSSSLNGKLQLHKIEITQLHTIKGGGENEGTHSGIWQCTSQYRDLQ